MTLLYYWRIARRARLVILGTTVSALLAALVVLYFLPKGYTAQASILTPKESTPQAGGLGALTALLGGGSGGGRDGGGFSLPAFLGLGPALVTNEDMFIAILKSQTSRNEVVSELAKKHGPDIGQNIREVELNTRDKGVIKILLDATNPHVAAEAANLYVDVLDRTLDRLARLTARRMEDRYVEQIERAAKEVAAAQAAVLKFQAENRVGPIEAIVRGNIDASGGRASGGSGGSSGMEPVLSLRASIMSLELQREVLRLRMTDEHPQMRELDKQISELKKQYAKNLFGAPMDLPGETPGQRRKELFVSTEQLTPVQFAYLKLYRNLLIQEAFYTGALQGLEQLKYNDGLNRIRVDPLDPAVPPAKPSRPYVLLTLLVATVAGIVLPILVIDVIDYLRRVRAEEQAALAHAAALDRAEHLRGLAPPDDALMPPDPFSVVGRGHQ